MYEETEAKEKLSSYSVWLHLPANPFVVVVVVCHWDLPDGMLCMIKYSNRTGCTEASLGGLLNCNSLTGTGICL